LDYVRYRTFASVYQLRFRKQQQIQRHYNELIQRSNAVEENSVLLEVSISAAASRSEFWGMAVTVDDVSCNDNPKRS